MLISMPPERCVRLVLGLFFPNVIAMATTRKHDCMYNEFNAEITRPKAIQY